MQLLDKRPRLNARAATAVFAFSLVLLFATGMVGYSFCSDSRGPFVPGRRGTGKRQRRLDRGNYRRNCRTAGLGMVTSICGSSKRETKSLGSLAIPKRLPTRERNSF